MIVSYHPYTLQFKEPAGTSRGVYHTRKVWYVSIHRRTTHAFGIGECAPLPDLSCDAVPNYEDILKEACHLLESRQAIPYDFLRPYPSILFGMETAWLSLEAMENGRSPFMLLESPFSKGEQGIAINGLVWMGSYDAMLRRMEEKIRMGFHCVKIKVGAIDWQQELELIRILRGAFPADILQLRLDANGGFRPDEALSRLHELAPYRIHSIEQPIRQGQHEQMARLCRESPVPIALDEELIGINDYSHKEALLSIINPHYIILKPSLHGGLCGSEEWMRLARKQGIGYWITSALESNIGLNAIAQWCALQHIDMPQGLGTGQLFVNNIDAPDLHIIGERLWCNVRRPQAKFQDELELFRKEWTDGAPSLTVYTSGSTGAPRPYTVEKSRMRASALLTLRFLRLQEGDTALLCMPLKYIAGKMMAVRAFVGNLRLRAVAPSSHPLQIIADLLKAEGFWESHSIDNDIPDSRHDETPNASLGSRLHPLIPDFIALTPMQAWHTLQEEAERMVFQHIPRIIIGGGSISHELHDALQQCRGEVYSSYGMTETLSHIALRRLNGSRQSDAYHLLPGIQISTTDEGCLMIDAPEICSERLLTHDLVHLRPDGSFTILGRTDNIISSGGIKLSLDELERRVGLLPVPYMLTATPDVALGEALTMLYVSPHGEALSEAELRQLLKTRLGAYGCPRHFFSVPELPLTETGKPARKRAGEMAAKMLREKWSKQALKSDDSPR